MKNYPYFVSHLDSLIFQPHAHSIRLSLAYIERLGKLYLMKIRHGNAFANAAGSSWRTVFVLALMPWLRQYRYMARFGDDWKAEIKIANRLENSNQDDDGNADGVAKKGKIQSAKDKAAGFVQEVLDVRGAEEVKVRTA